ncbi:hypothetical protein HDU67_010414 [Dinochytrium kinnereticum]|nr:hypothetical protein HDU67_010414 [Dinochytrium kinnereticum]
MISEHTKAAVRKNASAHFDNVPLSVPASTNPTIAVAATAEPQISTDATANQNVKRPLKASTDKPLPGQPTAAGSIPLQLRKPATTTLIQVPSFPPGHQQPTLISIQGQPMMAIPAGANHPPGTLLVQSQVPMAPVVGMTGMMAHIHLNATAVPPPVNISSPSGPTPSWSTPVLEELKVESISEPIRKALRKLDAITAQAVKERNQFADMTRMLVNDMSRQRDVGRRYVAIIKQLQPMVPIHVQVGVKMDLDEIAKISNDPSLLSAHPAMHVPMPATMVAPAAAPAMVPIPQTSQQSPTGQPPQKRAKTNSPPSDSIKRKKESDDESVKPMVIETAPPPAMVAIPGRSVSTPISRNPSITTTDGLARLTTSNTLPSPTTPTTNPPNTSFPIMTHTAHLQHPPATRMPRVLGVHCQIQNDEVVCAMAISKPFKYLFTASCGTIKIWDVEKGGVTPAMVASIECSGKNYIRGMKITPDGRTLLAAGEFQEIAICDIGTTNPNITGTIPTPNIDTYAIEVTPDSIRAITCGSDHMAHLWQIRTKELIRSFSGHSGPVTSCALSADMTKVYTGSIDDTIRIWNMETGETLGVFTFPTHVYSLDLDPFSSIMTAGLKDSIVQKSLLNGLHDPSEATDKPPFPTVEGCSWPAIRYSRNGGWYIGANTFGKVQMFRSLDSQKIGEISETDAVLCADVAGCGGFVVTGSSNSTATVYKISYDA